MVTMAIVYQDHKTVPYIRLVLSTVSIAILDEFISLMAMHTIDDGTLTVSLTLDG